MIKKIRQKKMKLINNKKNQKKSQKTKIKNLIKIIMISIKIMIIKTLKMIEIKSYIIYMKEKMKKKAITIIICLKNNE